MRFDDLTVACVLWQGDFRGRTYSPEWVIRLRSMVARNLALAHRFVCLSNVDIPGVETIPLKRGWPGWFSKVELFDTSLSLGKRVLYLDLDTIITGDLSPLVEYPAQFAVTPPHQAIVGHQRVAARHKYQSSCMVWTPPAGAVIYDAFTPKVMASVRGDQDWIEKIAPGLPTMPAKWFRKLRACKDGPPEGVKVVLSMPWKNDVAARKFRWVADAWK